MWEFVYQRVPGVQHGAWHKVGYSTAIDRMNENNQVLLGSDLIDTPVESHRHADGDPAPQLLTSKPTQPCLWEAPRDPEKRVFRGREVPRVEEVTDAEKRHRETQPLFQSHTANDQHDQAWDPQVQS